MDGILTLVVAAFLGVFSSFGGSLVSPVHDTSDTKQLDTVADYKEYDGYAQQRNDGSGTRSMIGGEAAPEQTAQTTAEETERPLIDVRRRTGTATQSGKVGENNANGNISVLTDN